MCIRDRRKEAQRDEAAARAAREAAEEARADLASELDEARAALQIAAQREAFATEAGDAAEAQQAAEASQRDLVSRQQGLLEQLTAEVARLKEAEAEAVETAVATALATAPAPAPAPAPPRDVVVSLPSVGPSSATVVVADDAASSLASEGGVHGVYLSLIHI